MKRKGILMALMLQFGMISAMAEKVPGMVVTMADSKLEIVLEKVENIKYSNGAVMVINVTEGAEPYNVLIDDIQKVTFEDVENSIGDGIEAITTDKRADNNVTIYDMNGARVASISVKKDVNLREILTGVGQGTYVVKIGNRVIKVIK